MDHTVTRNINRDLAMRLRLENREQFNTLVKMHLSFELDLHTEENEESFHEKGLFKKFNRFSKKTKPICTSTKTSNSPEQDKQILTKDLIVKLANIAEFLVKEENLIQEGIFRRTGSVARQTELKNLLLSGKQPINLNAGDYTVHDCASVLKAILSDMSEPLLTDAFYSAHCQLAAQYNGGVKTDDQCAMEARLTNALQLLFLLLPAENRELLDCILKMLQRTTEYTDKNLMNADSLSTLFTPHLICPRKLAPEALHSISQQMSGLVSFMIRRADVLFDVPTKLSTDIKMYFVEQKRKRTMSPEMLLDESVTSDSTAATVFTFIDREKTAQAHDSNPTDQALAQLYAHIQSMPESSKKRKLVKQFNKENGHGTPLQILMVNRMKQGLTKSSSLGDSIKRHIFSKGLLPKTPKTTRGPQGPAGTPSGCGSISATPNRAHFSSVTNQGGMTPKKRVLFQTPLKPEPMPSHGPLTARATPTAGSSGSTSVAGPSRSQGLMMMMNKGNCASTDCLMEETSLKKIKRLEEELEAAAVEGEGEGEADTPQMTRQLLKKYPSEPNLKSCYFAIVDESTNGSVVEQAATSNSGYAAAGVAGKVGVSLWDLVTLARATAQGAGGGGEHSSRERLTSLNGTQQSLLTDDERPSMSPITKSTRRMPKYMQESIMTPRSRKPVMLLGMTLNNTSNASILSDQQKSLSFREEDEYSSLDLQATRNESDLMRVSSFETTATSTSDLSTECCPPSMIHTSIQDSMVASLPPMVIQGPPDSLTGTFRDYLLSRSVMTESPADLSFSSQPDDFGPNMDDIRELNESEMTDSLLYCLDGNKPAADGEMVANKENLLDAACRTRKRPSDECELKLNAEEERQIKKLVLHVQHDTTGLGETSL